MRILFYLCVIIAILAVVEGKRCRHKNKPKPKPSPVGPPPGPLTPSKGSFIYAGSQPIKSGMEVLTHSETIDGQHVPAGATVQVSNFVNPTSYKPPNLLGAAA